MRKNLLAMLGPFQLWLIAITVCTVIIVAARTTKPPMAYQTRVVDGSLQIYMPDHVRGDVWCSLVANSISPIRSYIPLKELCVTEFGDGTVAFLSHEEVGKRLIEQAAK